MITCVGKEEVEFSKPLTLVGKVETYLSDVIDTMRASLNDIAAKSVQTHKTTDRDTWLKQDPSQITLLVNIMAWCNTVEGYFKKISGNKDAMSDCLQEQKDMLTGLIKIVQGDIDKPLRQKVMCMITMDTHSRDIIEKLRNEEVKSADEFQWQSQLKAYWSTDKTDCNLRITDASFWYGYEYLGNGPRLVVTPLTDRIYVTAC